MVRSSPFHREHDDGEVDSEAQLAAQFEAVHVRHGKVRDDQVRRPLARELQSAVAIVGDADFVSAGGEASAQHPGDLGFVVDHEDSLLVSHVSLISRNQEFLGHDVDIDRRCVPEKLVDRIRSRDTASSPSPRSDRIRLG